MYFIPSYYKNTISYDFINSFNIENINQLSKLDKLVISFNSKNTTFNNLLANIFFLELFTSKSVLLKKNKKKRLRSNVNKGAGLAPIDCKVILHKDKLNLLLHTMYKFSLHKDFYYSKNLLSLSLNPIIQIPKARIHYSHFKLISSLNVNIVYSTIQPKLKKNKSIHFLQK